MAKLFIFCPTFRNEMSAATHESLEQLGHALIHKGIPAFASRLSWPDIEELRNTILSYWYDVMPDSTHLLFVDSDMRFPPEVVLDMLTFNEPVVGVLYRKRSLELDWAASSIQNPESRPGFLELEGVGTGVFLIRRDAVTTLIEHFPELIYEGVTLSNMREAGLKRTLGFFDQMRTPEGKVAEDISFCRRWRATGGKIWGSIGYEIGHIGDHDFSGCFARDAVKPDVAQAAE